jgi:shikimate kinase
MRITITGPRSIGKSTVSKIVAKKLKLKYISSDSIGEKALKKHGGLDKAIKSGVIKKFIKKKGYTLIAKEYKKDNFVLDLSGGSVSSKEFERASKKLRKIVKSKSLVIGLLPYKNQKKSLILLFKRESKRKHFKKVDKALLLKKVTKDYKKFPLIFKQFCDIIIYMENKTPSKVAQEAISKIK